MLLSSSGQSETLPACGLPDLKLRAVNSFEIGSLNFFRSQAYLDFFHQ